MIHLGYAALRSNNAVDYHSYYDQQSDVCMLRLFDSFLESAPQLVFHLYVMLVNRTVWTDGEAAWTGISAIASMVREIVCHIAFNVLSQHLYGEELWHHCSVDYRVCSAGALLWNVSASVWL